MKINSTEWYWRIKNRMSKTDDLTWNAFQINYKDIQQTLNVLCKNTTEAEIFAKVMAETRALVTSSKKAKKILAKLGIEFIN